MTTTYELYTNENGTPKAVEGKAPAIIERVEALETDVTGLQSALDGKQAKGDYATTAVMNTELAKRAPVSHTHTKSQITGLQSALDGKQAKGDYATTAVMNTELAKRAPVSHTHTKSQITDFPVIPDTSTLIPKSGNRGTLAGYSSSATGTTVNATSGDSLYASANVTVANGATGQTWTKVVKLSAGTVTLGTNWAWVGGEAPELKYPCLLVCHWNQDKGIAGIVAGVA